MELKSEQVAGTTYLLYEIKANERLDQLSLGMLTNNKIPGILPTTYYVQDDKRYIRYNISSKVTLKSFFAGTVNRKQLLTVFQSMAGGLLTAEEYMIEQGQAILEPDNIYINVGTSESFLMFLPIEGRDSEADLRKVLKAILFDAQFDTRENGDYILEISNYLNGVQNFSAVDFKKMIQKLQEKAISAVSQRGESMNSSTVQAKVQTQTANQPNSLQIPKQAESKNTVPPALPVVPVQPKKKGLFSKKEKTPKTPVAPKTPKEVKEAKPQSAVVGGKAFLIPGNETPVTMASVGKTNKKPEKEKKPEKASKSLFSFGLFGKKKEEVQPIIPEAQPAPIVQPVLPKQSFISNLPTGETTVLNAEPLRNETTVLGESPYEGTKQAVLLYKKTGERIAVNKQVFRLGKEASYVDYCINGNSAVSRSHADIIQKEGNYYIVDNNSLNHTYLDDRQLASGEEAQLINGSKIVLADEEFEFQI